MVDQQAPDSQQAAQSPLSEQQSSPQQPNTPIQGPAPAGKPRKPFYKKWWFWAIVIVVVLAAIGGVGSGGSKASSSSSAAASSSASSSSDSSSSSDVALESISASYSGKTDEGTTIKKGTSGLTVNGKYADGSTKQIKDYEVDKPVTLAAGETATVTITSQGKSCTLEVKCTSMTEDQFKESCESVDYESLARDPESWKGKNIVVTGKVIQVMEDSGGNTYRVSITEGNYGIWTDPVLVVYKPTDSSNRILEDDIVTVYATSSGLYTYKTVMGASQTVPSMLASYIDIE